MKKKKICLIEATRLKEKYPDRIPVIVNTIGDLKIDRNKYLVPQDLTLAEFMVVIRKRINIESYEALYMFINGNLHPSNTCIKNLVLVNNSLTITITKESTFG